MTIKQNYDNEGGWAMFQESSIRTPGYRSIVASGGQLPDNGYFLLSQGWSDPKVMTYNGLRNCRDAGYVNTDFDPMKALSNGNGGPSIDSMFTLLSNKMAKRSHQIEINIGESLGEYRETFRTIATAAQRLTKAARAARRKDPKGVVRHLFGTNASKRWRDIPKDASSAWLGYSYGVAPIVQTVYDSFTKYKTGLSIPNKRSLRTSMLFTHSVDSTVAQYYRANCELTTRGYAKIIYGVTNPVTATMQGLNLTNPAMVAWELTPLSFIVDWFVPIGSFIQCIAPPAGLNFVSGTMSIRTACSKASYSVEIPWGWNSKMSNNYFALKIRRPLSEFPRFVFTFADYDNFTLEQSKVLSILAILSQRML